MTSWQRVAQDLQRDDRYSEIRAALPPDMTVPQEGKRVEMSYIGG